jgi:hypothetical protein
MIGVSSAQTPSPEKIEFFEKKVRPLFASRCTPCHAGTSNRAGLNLSTPQNIARGGDSGPIVSTTKPEDSKLLKVVGYNDRLKMPPTGKLSDQEIADLQEWVRLGAPMPAAGPAAAQAKRKEFTKGQKEFWSFQPVKAPPVPSPASKAWVRNPVDAFILAKLEEKGIAPAPKASKTTLIRRATFDLTGLPPTPAEIQAFEDDQSPDAFAKVVDRLLASPRYGERWGRQWLDVARYADSTGADEDHRYPHAWRYRDYVIDAFNSDLPYDQFVREQIAGDLLPSKDGGVNVKGIVATGFLALGPRLIAEQDKVKMLYDFIDEQIDTTSRAFLGLTVACARCHDHKFDPIPTRDYYSMASIFANSKAFTKIEGTVSQMYFAPLVEKSVADAYEAAKNQVAEKRREIEIIKAREHERQIEALKPKLADYMLASQGRPSGGLDPRVVEKWKKYLEGTPEDKPQIARWLTAADKTEAARAFQKDFENVWADFSKKVAAWRIKYAAARAAGAMPPDVPKAGEENNRFFTDVVSSKGPFGMDDSAMAAEARASIKSLTAQAEELKKAVPPEPPMACAVAEGTPVTQHVFVRGDAGSPGEEVPSRFLSIIAGENQPPITQGSGRMELARWLTDPKHPLTSRVMVNRIWQGHFTEGLVRTASNWGLLGEKPSHPELLDWLASEFVRSGWSIKAMHKLILLSNTYQMSSDITKQKSEVDTDNRLLSRFPRRRLDVEEIRDSMLMLDGSIDLTMGGTLQSGTGTDGENSEARRSINPATVKRRTVYLPLRRSNLPTLLNLFDFGDATTTGEGRSRTNVAPQALFMMNSAFVTDRANELAKQVSALPERERVLRSYRTVLARQPENDEIDAALAFIASMKERRGSDLAAWQSFCRVLLSSNEFLYVD